MMGLATIEFRGLLRGLMSTWPLLEELSWMPRRGERKREEIGGEEERRRGGKEEGREGGEGGKRGGGEGRRKGGR